MRDPRKIIVRPLLTEKSNAQRESENTYAFKVCRDANKEEIKKSIEEIFKVHVIEIRTANYMGKPKKRGRFEGRRPNWKKAIIKLAKGENIAIFEGI